MFFLSYDILGDSMKVDINDNKIVVFLNKKNIDNIDFSDKKNLERNFKDLFLKLNHLYDIPLYGYYDVHVYINDHYGLILDIEKENFEYFDYDNQIDMRITISKNNELLYKLDDLLDIDKNIINKSIIYKCKKELYLNIKEEFDNYEMGKLFEYSTLIYGPEADNIIKHGKLVERFF